MKVSIIIASFNRLPLLQKSVESALNQDYPQVEVLVVDDGSGQATTQWLLQTAAENPKLQVFLDSHRGPAAARARGIAEAKGELICILDSDDLLLPHALENIVQVFDKNRQTDLVYVDIRQSQDDGSYSDRHFPSYGNNKEMIWATLLHPRVPFKHSGTTFRREAALSVGSYDVGLPSKIDIDFYLKFLSCEKRLHKLAGGPFVVFNVHANSMSMHRFAGLKSWFILIDRYGPPSILIRFGLKLLRSASEALKFGFSKTKGYMPVWRTFTLLWMAG